MDSDQEPKKGKFEQDMDDWGDRFGRRMDEWGERFGKNVEDWPRRRYRRQTPGKHLFGGMIFLTLGVIFLLGNMGMVNPDRILRYWPVILIAGGLLKLFGYRDSPGQSSGIFWIVVGSIFLTGSLGILPIAWWDLWPILLIGLGVTMLMRYLLPKSRGTGMGFAGGSCSRTIDFRDSAATGAAGASRADEPREGPASSNSMVSATAILGGVGRRNNSPDFRGGSATAILGGCEIDLRAASITSGHEPTLEVFALWGGIEVRVPPDWTVVSQVDPILGGYEDKTQPPKEETKRFIIRGPVVMGGIEVKN